VCGKRLAESPCARVRPWGHGGSVPCVLLAEHTDMSSSEVTEEANEHESKTSLSELWREVSMDNREVSHLGVAPCLHLCHEGGGVIARLQMSYSERHMGVPALFCDSSSSTFRVSPRSRHMPYV
jgi:hypothetical protein